MPDIEEDRDWWKGAVIYHIYPRSFLDTTGNGIGDLPGIAQRLEYVASLGVDAVWISPFVSSPMYDFGYDVSDYFTVDPLFGSGEDFSVLLEKAHDLGLRVLMDQVLSHTSEQHPWFLESRSDRDNPKANWYVWADPKPDGSPPNNWLSMFGGSSWKWEPRRSQYYLHNFLRQQPDLNFHEPAVRQAALDICRHWLSIGVDGFRLDVCANYFHDTALRDNPANPEKMTGYHFLFNPYSLQLHEHDIAQPENLAFLEELRALCESFGDRILLGELHEREGMAMLREYTSAKRLHLAYGTWLLGAEHLDAETLIGYASNLDHALDSGLPAWALDNHDFVRSPTRLNRSGGDMLVLFAALSCMRGAVCLYQGSELCLPQAEVPYDSIVDPFGREFYPAFQGRDGSRTPIPWDADKVHCGFSSVEPWLPIPETHRALAVEQQSILPGSYLNRLRQFLNWRRTVPALRSGGMEIVEADEPVLAFRRTQDDRQILCVFNLHDDGITTEIPVDDIGIPMQGSGFDSTVDNNRLRLPSHGAYFGEIVPEGTARP